MIAVWARILALVTPALLVSSRYALGLYGLRLYLIVSALAVPIALLWQTGSLYAQVIVVAPERPDTVRVFRELQ